MNCVYPFFKFIHIFVSNQSYLYSQEWTLTDVGGYVAVVVSDPEVPEDGGLVEVAQRDHVVNTILAEVLTGLDRTEVVERERLGDVVDHRLDRDHLELAMKIWLTIVKHKQHRFFLFNLLFCYMDPAYIVPNDGWSNGKSFWEKKDHDSHAVNCLLAWLFWFNSFSS